MKKLQHFIILGLIMGVFIAPIPASALGVSFGGRVVAVVPCFGGMLHVTILGSRAVPVPEFYIWTPLTITKLYGPPLHPGQQVLGVADIPFTCFAGIGLFALPIPLFGLRMQMVGTSAI